MKGSQNKKLRGEKPFDTMEILIRSSFFASLFMLSKHVNASERSDSNVRFFSAKMRWSKTDYLFIMLSIWTSVHILMEIVEFAKFEGYATPETMPFGYFMLLFLYVIKKASDLWLNIQWKKRKGELYLISWFIVMMVMYIIQFATNGEYVVPRSLLVTIIGIVIAYACSMISTVAHFLVTTPEGNSLLKCYIKNKFNNGNNKTAK